MRALPTIFLLACAAREHTVVIEKLRVERIQGAPCMDIPPDVQTFDWPGPNQDGSITLAPDEVAELGRRLVELHTYALVQFSRCAIKTEEDEEAAAEVPMSLACRPTTGRITTCVVHPKVRPRAPLSGWWRP